MASKIKKFRIIPPLFQMDLNSLLLIVCLLIITVSCFALHFVIQFSALVNKNLDLFLIVFHYIGVIFGSAIYMWKLSTFNQNRTYIPYYGAFTLSLILLLYSTDLPLVILFMFLSGFFVAVVFIMTLQFFGFFFNNPMSDGLLFFSAMPGFAIFMIIEAWLSEISFTAQSIYLLLLFGLGALLFFGTTRNNKFRLPSRFKNKKLKYFFRKRDNWPFFLFYFFMGTILVSVYYPPILIIQSYPEYIQFLIILLASLILLFLPIGNLYDILGRKASLSIGIFLHSLAYVTLIFTQDTSLISKSIIFPVLLALGFSITIMGAVLFLIESEKTEEYIETAISGVGLLCVGLGGTFAVIIIEIIRKNVFLDLLQALVNDQFLLLPIFILSVYIPPLLIVFSSKETRVSGEEKYWWKSTEYVFVLNKKFEVTYEDTLWAYQEDEDYKIFLETVKKESGGKFKEKTIREEEKFIIMGCSENGIVILISSKELKILHKKIAMFLNDFEAMGALWKKDRILELVHKYLIKQEYVEKSYTLEEQARFFGQYVQEIKSIPPIYDNVKENIK
ncbi:MAG: MFS transporter [Candidatus Hodarchaeales archaeon]